MLEQWNKRAGYSKYLLAIAGIIAIWFGVYFYYSHNSDTVSQEMGLVDDKSNEAKSNSPKEKIEFARTDIGEADINNATFRVWGNSEVVKLKDGIYENKEDLIVSKISELIITDLNGDGYMEGVAIIDTSRADSMQELFVVVNDDGRIFTYPVDIPLEDGNMARNIQNIKVSKGIISMTLDIMGPNDPRCCPSIHGVYDFVIKDGVLVKSEPAKPIAPISWLKYQNDKYGFEIKYPSNFSIFADTDQTKGVVIPVTKNSKNIYITGNEQMFFCCEPGFILIEILDKYTDVMESVKAIKKDGIGPEFDSQLISEGYVKINGQDFYKIVASEHVGFKKYLINHNNVSYLITSIFQEQDEDIIGTFKFTK
jgi:hypothetical protein